MTDDRLIEDYIPVEAINIVAQREKIGHAAFHPRKLHLWWARRPLAAARAAVYATLVHPHDAPDNARDAAFFTALCQWGASDRVIAEARQRVLEANGGVPPKVLDQFAGGGAIPLEALRLGCEATAVELNPVAHLIEKCMLDYPQRYGPSLADDIREHGRRWVERTWGRVGHLYPRLRDVDEEQLSIEAEDPARQRTAGRPIAYLWTRTVPCPNPERPPHTVALVRQTWLAKKKGRNVALRPIVDRDALSVSWQVVEAANPESLGFDPAAFSTRGATTCLACGAAVDYKHVQAEGLAGRMGIMPLAAVLVKASGRGRDYLPVGTYAEPDEAACLAVLDELDVQPPDEPIPRDGGRWFSPPLHGLTRYRDLFTPRQLATLCAFAQGVRETHAQMLEDGMEPERAAAVATYLALALDRTVDRNCNLCRWDTKNESLTNAYSRQALPMVWDFSEANPFGQGAGQAHEYVENIAGIVKEELGSTGQPGMVYRTSADQLPMADETYDAVITDPPYYDNISYADLSDFFYVWLKRSLQGIAPDDIIGGELTPKRREAIVAPYRFDGDKAAARRFYEQEMAAAFTEAHRVLKPGAPLVCVYAHKTTLGWATLVEALRRAGFTITEAWPLDTEMPERAVGQGTASLASSIFLVARKRDGAAVGDSDEVQRQLDAAIAERLDRLIAAGVSGSDLVIATIGAGLAPFTRYASVELPNGETLPADRFLEAVQGRVLGAILAKVHGLGDGVGGLDAATRYYVMARFSYGYADVDFDEANSLARSAGIELGNGLSRGRTPLAKITKKAVRLHDFEERGEDPELGLDGTRLIDVLHGLLWRANHRRSEVRPYLDQTRPDPQRLRLVTQALQGSALRGENESKPAEAQACERLLGSWRTLVEENLFTR
jgi:putative DNA methylase